MDLFKQIGCLTALLMIALFASGQSHTQTLRGTVVDKDSKVPIIGANIVLLNSDPFLGGSTDLEGHFRIEEVLVGRHDIMVTYLGYEDLVVPQVLVVSGKEKVIAIELTESIIKVEEVVVIATRDKEKPVNEISVVSTRTFSVEETKRYPGTVDDPSRMALSFAGVSGGSDDIANEIVIRGNSPRGLMWRLEGVEIPSPNHFTSQGSASGAVSILSSTMLSTSDFSTGAFAAEYGNALSGVFDISLRKGNNEKHEGSLQLSMLGVNASAEGPFKKGHRASYLVNYRYSTLAILQKAGLDLVNGADPTYQDLAFKIHYPTTKAGNFALFGIAGISDVNQDVEGTLPNAKRGVVNRQVFGSTMGVVGLTHNYIVNPKFYLQSVASFDVSQSRWRYWAQRNEELTLVDRDNKSNYDGRISIEFNNKFNARHQLKSGMTYTSIFYNLFTERYRTRTQSYETTFEENGHTSLVQGFSNWRFRLTETLTMNTGVHLMWFALNNSYSIEPRWSMKWQFKPNQSLTAGVGMHSRMEGLTIYTRTKELDNGTTIQPNKDLDFTRAIHFVLGYDNMIVKDLYLKLEAYYQHLYDVPVSNCGTCFFSSLNVTNAWEFNWMDLVNEGKGRNFGLEITLEKFFSNNFFFMLNGSLYASKFSMQHPNSFFDGKAYNSTYNGVYVANMLGGKEFVIGKDKNNIFGLSARLTWAGGKRYTPPDEFLTEQNNQFIPDIDRINGEQTPSYFRTDCSIYYQRNKRRANMEWKLEVQNLTNRANVMDTYYSEDQEAMIEVRRGQLTPVLSYKVEF